MHLVYSIKDQYCVLSQGQLKNKATWTGSQFVSQQYIIKIVKYFLLARMHARRSPDHDKQQVDTLSFERDSDEPQLDDLKNEYSTFIQQLEETTEKLMNEVFNTEYKPEDAGQQQDQNQADYYQSRKASKNSRAGQKGSHMANLFSRMSGSELRSKIAAHRDKAASGIQGSQTFRNFMTRNQRWCELKSDHIKREQQKKDQNQRKNLTYAPQILRGSKQKLDPIYERAQELHVSKEKRRAFKQLEEKKLEEEEISKYTFQPQIISKNKPRTLDQYLRDKADWEQKKLFNREVRKLRDQAQRHRECSFVPQLVAKQIQDGSYRKADEKVEERLLRSLQKVFIQI